MTNVFTSALSFVERIGQDTMHLIQDGVAFAAKAQPVANFIGSAVSIFEPALAPIVSTVLSTASYVEAQFAAAGNATGTGAQKFAIVSSLLGPLITQALQALGKPSAATDVTNVINGIVNLGKNDPNIWQELETLLGNPPAAAATTATVGASVVTTEKVPA